MTRLGLPGSCQGHFWFTHLIESLAETGMRRALNRSRNASLARYLSGRNAAGTFRTSGRGHAAALDGDMSASRFELVFDRSLFGIQGAEPKRAKEAKLQQFSNLRGYSQDPASCCQPSGGYFQSSTPRSSTAACRTASCALRIYFNCGLADWLSFECPLSLKLVPGCTLAMRSFVTPLPLNCAAKMVVIGHIARRVLCSFYLNGG